MIAFSGTASASEALAQKNGCTKCHDVEKKKKGPSFKASAAKFKGKSGSALEILAPVGAPASRLIVIGSGVGGGAADVMSSIGTTWA